VADAVPKSGKAIIEQQEQAAYLVDFCQGHQLDNKYFHARTRCAGLTQQRKQRRLYN